MTNIIPIPAERLTKGHRYSMTIHWKNGTEERWQGLSWAQAQELSEVYSAKNRVECVVVEREKV